MKTTLYILLFLTLAGTTSAQNLEFNKKSGEFSSNGTAVAKLTSERVKIGKVNLGLGVGKNYFVMDPAESTELIGYMLQWFRDTLGGPTHWYYTIRCNSLGLAASRDNFNESLNTFRDVGEHVIKNNLLTAEGKLNEPAVREYFARNAQPNYPEMFARMNDSMVKLITGEFTPVERDKSKPVTANQFGKVGQGNTVIGSWELVTVPPSNGIGSNEYHYIIRNLNGGIAAIAWVSLGGATVYVFRNGERLEDRIVLGPADSPITTGQLPFVAMLATKAIAKGSL